MQKPGDIFERAEVEALISHNPWLSTWQVVHCWGTILLTWAICVIWTNPLTILLGIMVIGGRQLGLGIISHDAAHHLLYKNRKLNDWVAEWLLARPLLGASVVPYRNYHLVHHRYTQQPNDPDLSLSAPLPITKSSFLRKVWRDLSGQTGWKQRNQLIREAFGKPEDPWPVRLKAGFIRLGPNLAINLVFLAGFTLAGAWYLYFLLWIVPSYTWQMLISRIRNIGEHACVPDDDDRLKNTRTTLANRLERLLVAPYYVNYHLEHHLLVSCPCYRLPQAHQMLLAKGLGPDMEIRTGYIAMLKHCISKPEPALA